MLESEIELSFVIPCLNEARTVATCVAMAQSYLQQSQVCGEVIVADNGSTDGSIELAKAAGARVVSVVEQGYGAALMGGIVAAQGRFVVMGDADASYDFRQTGQLLAGLRAGAALVVGNRFLGGVAQGAMPPLHRYLGNPVLSFLGRLFFNIKLGDFHCGLRGFDRAAILALDLRTTGMEFASEIIVRAALAGLPMSEAPIALAKDGRGRKSHMRSWRDGWRHLRFLLLYSPRWLYLYPGLAMIIFGLVIAGLLLPGPFMVTPQVGLDVHTLLVGALSILVGVQSTSFALMARHYAVRQGILPKRMQHEWLDNLTVERLLILAAIVLLCGASGIFYAAHLWSSVNFGALDYRNVMRVMIVSTTGIVGGLQIGFAAFMLGIMDIKQR
jgi:glycosyltransferase involved in cell wall biosynthesis